VITGGDSGIGRAVAIAFAREGAHVLLSYLSAKRTAMPRKPNASLNKRREKQLQCCDIQDPQTCRDLVARANQEFGRLDVLVNNAAYQMAQEKLDDFTVEQIERTYRTNILAMSFLCQAAVPLMKPGSSINVVR
jgi:NAD(P)-dependent dehydrogenase (short-subunit alcohol dehydrogenase family)